MATVLETKLLPTDREGGYLLVCGVRNLNTSGLDHEDTRYAIARSGCLDADDRVDLLTAMTVPRPPSKALAKVRHRDAKGQLELAESGRYGPEADKHYRENYRRFTYAAEMAMTEQVWLPHDIATSRNQRAFAALSVGRLARPVGDKPSVVLRFIDCQSGDVLLEERLKAARFGMATEAYRLWCKSRGSILLGTDGQTLLVRNSTGSDRNPKGLFEEIGVAKGLPVISQSDKLPVVIDGFVTQTDDRWIASEHSVSGRGSELIVFEKGSLKKVTSIELSREPASICASPAGNLVLCGFIGGAVWAVDLESHTIRKFSPHIGAGRDDWVTVHIADNEEFFVSECNDQLVLTRLDDGTSATAHKLKKSSLETEPFEGVDTSVKIWPTFAVLGNRIAVSEEREIQELPADTEQYEHRFVSEVGRPGARKPVKVSRKAPLADSIEKARLGEHSEQIIAAHSPALTIATKKLGKRGWALPELKHAPELGASRFGGWPDLPAGMSWPTWQERPMAFLGQIDLADAQTVQANPQLPEDGMLSFFLGCSSESFSGEIDPREQYLVELIFDQDHGEPNGWQVIHTPASSSLERRILESEPLPELFRPSALRFKAGGKSLPDEGSPAFDHFAFSPDERADYLEMAGQLQKEAWDNQLMGYPTMIQFTRPECYLEANDFRFPGADDPGFAAFVERASEWLLLLQLTSDPNPDFTWGDGGHFYFYVRRDALLARDFSGVRVFFEN